MGLCLKIIRNFDFKCATNNFWQIIYQTNQIMNTSYVFLAPGFEEIEAVAPVDVMRRAGMPVKTVSILSGNPTVVGAHSVPYVADMTIDQLPAEPEAEWLIFPGGMPGSTNLYECKPLMAMLSKHSGNIAAICAAPAVIFGQSGLLKGVRATCYPGMESLCEGAEMTGEHVTRHGRILTAQGPAWATAFGLAIVEASLGAEVANEVAAGMLMPE